MSIKNATLTVALHMFIYDLIPRKKNRSMGLELIDRKNFSLHYLLTKHSPLLLRGSIFKAANDHE